MKNSELLAHTGSSELLGGLDNQKRYVLRIEAQPRPCPNCSTLLARWQTLGITDVDDYSFDDHHPDLGECPACKRGLKWTVPLVGDPFFDLVPIVLEG